MANAAEGGALDEDEDYYAVLNVGRDVSLSLLYLCYRATEGVRQR